MQRLRHLGEMAGNHSTRHHHLADAASVCVRLLLRLWPLWGAWLWLAPGLAHAQTSNVCVESRAVSVECQPTSAPSPETSYKLDEAPMCGADGSSLNAPPPLLPPTRAQLRAADPDADDAANASGVPGSPEPRVRPQAKLDSGCAVLLAWSLNTAPPLPSESQLETQSAASSGVRQSLYRPPRSA